MRVVLDANVIISGVIAPLGASAAILKMWRDGTVEVVTCPGVLAEIAEKLRLPRIKDKYSIREEEIVELLVRLAQSARLVPAAAVVDPLPPDPDDVMLFSAALESDAEYIVTGDKALLEFTWNGRAKIVSPRQFCEALP